MPIKPSFVPIKLQGYHNTQDIPEISHLLFQAKIHVLAHFYYVTIGIPHVSHDCDDNISCQLNKIRSTNINNVVLGLLNINSVIRKIDALKSIISGMIDFMIIVEC